MSVLLFWAFLAGFGGGVLVRSFVVFEWWTVLFVVFLALAVALLSWLRSHTETMVVAAVLAGAALGCARMHSGMLIVDPVLAAQSGSDVRIEGVVVDEPDVRENSDRLTVRVRAVGESIASGAVLAIVPLHSGVAYGDVVRVEGKLRLPAPFETGEGRVFDYPAFLAKDGISHEVAFASVEQIGSGEGNVIKAAAIAVKQMYVRGIMQTLPEPAAGLASGITVGDKRGVGSDLSEVFQAVSLTHIIVLSGYNIMIVIIALMWAMNYFALGKWWQFGIGVVVAIFFALITGLAAASVRAAAMATIALLGKVSGRIYLAGRALGIVAFGMVLWNPYILAFDPGFQLSVIATTGLIVLSPLLTPYLSRIPEMLNLREIVSSSLSAHIAVFPFLLYQGGMVALYAVPANLLSLVVVPYAMLLSLIAALLGLSMGPLAPVLAFPAYALLTYIIFVARFFASLPFATIATPSFGIGVLAAAYALLALWIWQGSKKAAAPIVPPRPISWF